MPESHPDAALATFLDTLLPGDAEWPAATTALADPRPFLTEPEMGWLQRAAAEIAAHPPAQRISAMQALEQHETAMFTRIVQALYAAYYATEATRMTILQRAQTGPREPSPLFDPRLLKPPR